MAAVARRPGHVGPIVQPLQRDIDILAVMRLGTEIIEVDDVIASIGDLGGVKSVTRIEL